MIAGERYRQGWSSLSFILLSLFFCSFYTPPPLTDPPKKQPCPPFSLCIYFSNVECNFCHKDEEGEEGGTSKSSHQANFVKVGEKRGLGCLMCT